MTKRYFSKTVAWVLSIVILFSTFLSTDLLAETRGTLLGDGYESLEHFPSGISPNLKKGWDPYGASEWQTQVLSMPRVRVSIIVDGESTLDKGYPVEGIGKNIQAISYRESLQKKQENVESNIRKALDGNLFDVVWNLTLSANIISAEVAGKDIPKIMSIPGVKGVVPENRYTSDMMDSKMPYDPQMSTSGGMIGSSAAYSAGYTGAGSRIAILDTGINLNHISFNGDALEYALNELNKPVELMDSDDILSVMSELNILKRVPGLSADELYRNQKVPFAANYGTPGLDVSHDSNTSDSEHGSHVAGISAANMYVPSNGGYELALDKVNVQGVAPNAQLIVMKVFADGGVSYESDFMVAIEDALLLGADSINLSLGSIDGFSHSDVYSELLDSLKNKGAVITVSAGNSGAWADETTPGALYSDDISFNTGSSPASYPNSMSVASADNVGYTGYYIKVGDKIVFYTESSADAPDLSTLEPGEYEFIYFDNPGWFDDLFYLEEMLGEEGFEGKILIVNRGGKWNDPSLAPITFRDKYDYAQGLFTLPAALIVVNNVPGEAFAMDLTPTEYSSDSIIPAVSVSLEAAELLKTNEAGVLEGCYFSPDGNECTDPEWDGWPMGECPYYTGTLTLNGTDVAVDPGELSDEGFYSVSSFSSWGVPGSLELKPEILAPGGNIYSVNGYGDSAYENMSGTSMAAPQVAGMAAILAEYIRNKNLTDSTGMTVRQLVQSLLMSTAEPVYESLGNGLKSYQSVLAQGAGLANVGNAVTAKSYVKMLESATPYAADGKIKVELGDDPDKDGEYDYGFELHNMTDTERLYTLSTDLFTQKLITNGDNTYLDKSTAAINAIVTYTVNGKPFDPDNTDLDADVNKDGKTDADDAQAILDWLTGLRSESELSLEAGDLSGDGKTTSYDAHLILLWMDRQLLLPAHSYVTVNVHIQLTDDLSAYENGAYIEGYTHVNTISTEEGEMDVPHSIPILGFYGNWSDPSMFDTHYTFEDAMGYGDIEDPYVEDGNGPSYNNYLVIYDNLLEEANYVYGNPYVTETDENGVPVYPTEKTAIRSEDDLLYYTFAPIRSGTLGFIIRDHATGEILWTGPVTPDFHASVLNASGYWLNATSSYMLNKSFADLGFEEGDQLDLSVVMVPEYYCKNGHLDKDSLAELVKSNVLGNGAFLTKTVKIDDTNPKILDISKGVTASKEGDLRIRTQDNQSIAYIAVTSRSGAHVFYSEVPNEAEGATVEVTIPAEQLSEIGEYCIVYVGDYAGNEAVETIKYDGPRHGIGMTGLFGFSEAYGEGWLHIDTDTLSYNTMKEDGIKGLTPVGFSQSGSYNLNVAAAAYADGYIFYTVNYVDLLYPVLYSSALEELDYAVEIVQLSFNPMGMTFASEEGRIHAIERNGTVHVINPITGEDERQYTLSIESADIASIAADNDNNFFAIGRKDKKLYTWSADDVTSDSVTPKSIELPLEISDWPSYSISSLGDLTWSQDDNCLYLTADAFSTGRLYRLTWDKAANTVTASKTNTNDNDSSKIVVDITGLFVISEKEPSGGMFDPTPEVDSITLSATKVTLYKDTKFKLKASIEPWNAMNQNVTWSSSDTSVATVDERGLVKLLNVGHAVITAVSALDAEISAQCDINVLPIPSIELNGYVFDSDQTQYWSSIKADGTIVWTPLGDSAGNENENYIAGAYIDDKLYTYDGQNIYTINPDTFETEKSSELPASDIFMFSDAAPLPEGKLRSLLGGNMMIVTYYGSTIAAIDPDNPETIKGIQLLNDDYTYKLNSPMAAIAYIGHTANDGETYIILTEDGNIHQITIIPAENGEVELEYGLYGNSGLDLTGVSDVSGSYASMIFDETSGLLVLSMYCTGMESAELKFIDISMIGSSILVTSLDAGDFGTDVWPVTALYQKDYSAITANIDGMHSVYKLSEQTSVRSGSGSSSGSSSSSSSDSSSDSGDFHMPDKTKNTESSDGILYADVHASENAQNNAQNNVWNNTQHNAQNNAQSNAAANSNAADAESEKISVDLEQNTITVKLDVNGTTNRFFAVEYDNTVLSLETAKGLTGFSSVNGKQAGKVLAAFASVDTLTADVVELVFSYEDIKECNLETSLTIKVSEDGEAFHEEPATETVTLKTNAEHIWGEERIVEPTCTEAGTKTKKCTICGEETSEDIPAKGHTFGEWKETDGIKTRKCEVCGYEEKEDISVPNPPTGVNSLYKPCVVVLISSCGALFTVLIKKKKYFATDK